MFMNLPVPIHRYPFAVQPLRQPFPGLWMEIPTQPQKLRFVGNTRQSQFFSPFAIPLARNATTFHVVISDAQMLLKILLRIRQIELRLHRQHDGKLHHDLDESAPKRAHHEHELVVMIIRTEYGTLDSLQTQGADVTTETTGCSTL